VRGYFSFWSKCYSPQVVEIKLGLDLRSSSSKRNS